MKVIPITEKGKVHLELIPENTSDEHVLGLLYHQAFQGVKLVYNGALTKQEASGKLVTKMSYLATIPTLREDEDPYEGLAPLKAGMLDKTLVKVTVKPEAKKTVVQLND